MHLQSEGQDQREFASWLLDIGHGRGLSPTGTIALRAGMECDSASSLIDFIYPGINSNPPPPPEFFLNRMILAPRNSDVSDVNSTVLGRMDGITRTYFSADKIIEEAGADGPEDRDETLIPVEFLRSLNSGSLPPGELSLKVGCPLILLRNLSPARGLCNGSRMILLRMSERVLECRLVGGDHDGETVLIPRISLTPSNTTEFAFKFCRRQFPVRLAFALTINKSQGQSVKFVGLDLRIPVFSHGQLYVGLSRATSGQRIKVLLPDNALTSETANVVYPEVLLD
jgi:ATP-dependent DNA helicase PIF1